MLVTFFLKQKKKKKKPIWYKTHSSWTKWTMVVFSTLYSQPHKWSNLMTVKVWERNRAYQRESDRPFYNRCFYGGESTLHWAVSHMRDTQSFGNRPENVYSLVNMPPPTLTTASTKYSCHVQNYNKLLRMLKYIHIHLYSWGEWNML